MVLFLRRWLLEEEDKEEVLESDLGGLKWSTGGILRRIATRVYSRMNYKS